MATQQFQKLTAEFCAIAANQNRTMDDVQAVYDNAYRYISEIFSQCTMTYISMIMMRLLVAMPKKMSWSISVVLRFWRIAGLKNMPCLMMKPKF